MKVLIYCQHVLGVGHLFRSLEIARAFHPNRVIFVEGGEPVKSISYPENVQPVALPPLMMDENFETLIATAGDIEAVKARRRDILLEVCRAERPDACIIELFPFGRKRFRFELIPLLETLKRDMPKTLVVSSIRDILVEKKDKDEFEEKVIESLAEFFDLLLVHSDPEVIALEESFSRVDRIPIPLEYTGYVVRKPRGFDLRKGGKGGVRRVVVSNGGGRVGYELIEAVVEAYGMLSEAGFELDIFPGPFMPGEARSVLEKKAARFSGVRLKDFSRDFVSELMVSDLSVSMAGYNTMMDLLSARVFGLVYPFGQNREQVLRAERFERLGLVKCIRSLDPGYLAGEIVKGLEHGPTVAFRVDTNGAERTRDIVERYVRQKSRL